MWDLLDPAGTGLCSVCGGRGTSRWPVAVLGFLPQERWPEQLLSTGTAYHPVLGLTPEAGRAKKEAFCPESLPHSCHNRLSLPANTLRSKDELILVSDLEIGKERLCALILRWIYYTAIFLYIDLLYFIILYFSNCLVELGAGLSRAQ